MKQFTEIINKLCDRLDKNGDFKKSDYFQKSLIKIARDYSESPEFMDIFDSIGEDEDLEDLSTYNSIYGDEPPGYGEELDLNNPLKLQEHIKNLKLEREAYNLQYKMLLKEDPISFRENEKKIQLWNRMEEIDLELQKLHDKMESKKFN